MRNTHLTARVAPWLLTLVFAPVANAGAPCGDDVACVSPGRVAFAVAPNGTWKFFGPSNDRSFIKKGGVLVYALSKGSDSEILDATGGVRSLLESPMAPVQEGVRGGAREPFPRPDDDYDGQVDEDPLDRIDNDGDGRIDEDFAAIGDAMTVALYGPKNDSGLQIRQELYAWTLPHIDAMVATAITLRAGSAALEGVRLGVFVETDGFEREAAPLIEAEYLGAASRTPRDEVLVWRDGGRGMALLLWAPSTSEDWEVREDKSGTRALSPSLGTLAANASTTIYAALIALPPDDLRSARAIQAAWRTLAGSKGTHLMPPPVSVTKRDEPATHETHEPATIGSPYGSVMSSVVYWNTPGKLTPSLLVGSPNPFRDTIAIDYEVPETVVDEHNVQHQLSGEAVETSVKVYNVTGRLIATLVESPHGPGRYRTGWSAQDDQGATVASGVYYVKLTIGRQSVTQRLVQLK